jgi:hypothetical protein
MIFSLSTATGIFVNSQEPGIQLDVFRENGQMLLQIGKGYDVKNWNTPLKVNSNDIILLLHFHKSKDHNSKNLLRFLNSPLFRNYERFQMQGQEMYFSKSATTLKPEILEMEIRELVRDIYELDNEEVNYSLKAY